MIALQAKTDTCVTMMNSTKYLPSVVLLSLLYRWGMQKLDTLSSLKRIFNSWNRREEIQGQPWAAEPVTLSNEHAD